MNLQEMISQYRKEGYKGEFASERVCQDIILTSLVDASMDKKVTLKGGVVMRSISNNARRATRDIDLDFIHYPLHDEAIKNFVEKLNCIPTLEIKLAGDIEELNQQDYHGKRIYVIITDENGTTLKTKIDIGVHKHFEIEQDLYCFDVFMNETGISLLKNTVEQVFVEKLRALLVWGNQSTRYKDIYDMFFLLDKINPKKFKDILKLLIFDDEKMPEKSIGEIIAKMEIVFSDKEFLKKISTSRQRWFDDSIDKIVGSIICFFEEFV